MQRPTASGTFRGPDTPLIGSDPRIKPSMGVTAMGRTGRPAAAAIRERFDISSTVYLQRPSSLIDREAAVTYRPMLVRRFR